MTYKQQALDYIDRLTTPKMNTHKYIEHCKEHIAHNEAIITELSNQIAKTRSEAMRIILEEEQQLYRAENVLLRHNLDNEHTTQHRIASILDRN